MSGYNITAKDNRTGQTKKMAYEYDDFGETTKQGDEDFFNEICYTGAIYDESTGLYYLNARYYDPEDGRFLTQDTYRGEDNEPGNWHLYAYCANNPANYVDPSGHVVITVTTGSIYILYNIAVSVGITVIIGERAYKIVKIIKKYKENGKTKYKVKVQKKSSTKKKNDKKKKEIKKPKPKKKELCFVAGTPVLTEEGLRPIENLNVGDKVYSYDEETGEISL